MERAELLLAAGRMPPAGAAQIAEARAGGRWDAAYEPQRTASVPPDFVVALEADPRAAAAFRALVRSERYPLILPLLKARDPQARALLVARTVVRLTLD